MPHDGGFRPARIDGAVTLRVTARLAEPARLSGWFPLPLDGLLTEAARRRGGVRRVNRGEHGIAEAIVPIPVAASGPGGVWANRWIWATTCAWWPRDRAAGWRAGIGGLVTTATTLQWWAIGDLDTVTDLLDPERVTISGAVVDEYIVDDCGPADHRRIWRDPDGVVGRPIPARPQVLGYLGVPAGSPVVEWRTRPPYIPDPARSAPTLAPWTRVP